MSSVLGSHRPRFNRDPSHRRRFGVRLLAWTGQWLAILLLLPTSVTAQEAPTESRWRQLSHALSRVSLSNPFRRPQTDGQQPASAAKTPAVVTASSRVKVQSGSEPPSLDTLEEHPPAQPRLAQKPSARELPMHSVPYKIDAVVTLNAASSLRAVGPDSAVESPQWPGSEPLVIDGREIACRSAQNWIPADLLRARAQAIVQLFCEEDDCTRQAAHALSNFLHMQADHQEDIGAAAALRAYYTRIALVEQLALARESREFVDQQSSRQNAAVQQGLPAGVDLTSFERTRLEIEDQVLQLRSQDRQLRCLLAQLAKVDYDMSAIEHEQLEIFQCPLDCQRLKQQALTLRHDLRGWRYLACQVNETSAPIFAKMLSSIVGGFGLPLPTISGLKQLLCPPDYSCLAANMQYELQLTVETHRKWICQAVDEKCCKLQLAYERIRLAEQTVESWRTRISQLERLDDSGDGQPGERATAQSELLKARADEIRRRLDAKLAEVDLAEASGGLRDRCCAGQAWLLTGYE